MKFLFILLVLSLIVISGGLMLRSSSQSKSTNTSPPVEVANEYPVPATLAERLEMGVVELNVADLNTVQDFYQQAVGLDVLSEDAKQVTLGDGEREVVRLVHTPQLKDAPVGSAGLYHTATVFASRAALAQAVKRVMEHYPHLYSGTSDHVVSEAFYFTDPEGNGVELYFDKDPAGWQWRDGKVVMGSQYIDPQRYIATYENVSASDDKKMGHVHLKVGNIETAKEFYENVLGFAETSLMPTALFVSDGKYHHHLGMNVWESANAGMREKTLGLASYQIFVPEQKNLEQLAERLKAANHEYVSDANGLRFDDPWGNTIVVTVNPAVFSE